VVLVTNLLTRALRIAKKEGYISLVKKSVLYFLEKGINVQLIGYIRVALAKRRLKRCISKINGIDDALNFVYSFKFLGIHIKPAQVKEEIEKLLRLLQKHRLETVLEMGTENGGTLFLFSHIASPNATLIGIDLPRKPFWRRLSEVESTSLQILRLYEAKNIPY